MDNVFPFPIVQILVTLVTVLNIVISDDWNGRLGWTCALLWYVGYIGCKYYGIS